MKKISLLLYCFLAITYAHSSRDFFDADPDPVLYNTFKEMGWQCFNWSIVQNSQFFSPESPKGITRTCSRPFLGGHISVSSSDTAQESCVSAGGIYPVTALTHMLQGKIADVRVLTGGYVACGQRSELEAFWRVMAEQLSFPEKLVDHMATHRYSPRDTE